MLALPVQTIRPVRADFLRRARRVDLARFESLLPSAVIPRLGLGGA